MLRTPQLFVVTSTCGMLVLDRLVDDTLTEVASAVEPSQVTVFGCEWSYALSASGQITNIKKMTASDSSQPKVITATLRSDIRGQSPCARL
ncbi:hypothetical protein DEJ33_14370 [Curtobacterium sp. MCPF17_047]|nr:hypothetical protein DEJ24_07920 [Curtobacterium sp. MCPF17_001]PZF63205.1 hypothetical protein DEJ33_14370 [Curtobacterium sp. MCPF17_047]